jgi:hypothetical protein
MTRRCLQFELEVTPTLGEGSRINCKHTVHWTTVLSRYCRVLQIIETIKTPMELIPDSYSRDLAESAAANHMPGNRPTDR